MTTLRQPAVAGMFYPSQAAVLQQDIEDYLAAATTPAQPHQPKAIIVPHAGYIYSGPVAASAYSLLRPHADKIRKVVLIGPSHRVPLLGLATSSADAFHTPLGDIPLDRTSIDQLEQLPQVKRLDQAHQMEHSLEVHLPFLQTVLHAFELIPLVAGEASSDEVAEVLDAVWGGDETLIVISSDLSHYYDYATARRMDQHTSQAIEQLKPEDIANEHACGRIPVRGLLRVAQQRGLRAHTVDLRNSGDTAGARDQVVGYGAYIID